MDGVITFVALWWCLCVYCIITLMVLLHSLPYGDVSAFIVSLHWWCYCVRCLMMMSLRLLYHYMDGVITYVALWWCLCVHCIITLMVLLRTLPYGDVSAFIVSLHWWCYCVRCLIGKINRFCRLIRDHHLFTLAMHPDKFCLRNPSPNRRTKNSIGCS